MSGAVFTPTKSNFELLRKRINRFLEKEVDNWGTSKLLKEAISKTGIKINKDPILYRHSLSRFLNVNHNQHQRTIDTDVASVLWIYMIKYHPSPILNSQKDYLDIAEHRMSYISRHFFATNNLKMADVYAPAIKGRFVIVRQAWKNRKDYDQLSIGEVEFSVPQDHQGHVIEIRELASSDDVNDEFKTIETAEGYAVPKGINCICLMRTSSNFPKIMTIEHFDPVPEKGKIFRSFHGSIYAAIGNGPHIAYRFIAQRLRTTAEVSVGNIDKIDAELLRYYGIKENNLYESLVCRPKRS